MDTFEDFILYVQQKPVDLEPIELYASKLFKDEMFDLIDPTQKLNSTINLHDALVNTYNMFLEYKTYIICLVFSDNKKIYVWEGKLCDIEYFNNMLEYHEPENIITEIPIVGILDNFTVMESIIDFVNYNGRLKYDSEFLYQVALLNHYLLECVYDGHDDYDSEDDYSENDDSEIESITLLEHLEECILDYFANTTEISKTICDTIYKTCILCNIDPYSVYIPDNMCNNQEYKQSLLYRKTKSKI
jgi:hypothetical protein